jgi:hypothetical protein
MGPPHGAGMGYGAAWGCHEAAMPHSPQDTSMRRFVATTTCYLL